MKINLSVFKSTVWQAVTRKSTPLQHANRATAIAKLIVTNDSWSSPTSNGIAAQLPDYCGQ